MDHGLNMKVKILKPRGSRRVLWLGNAVLDMTKMLKEKKINWSLQLKSFLFQNKLKRYI
jgi:hypothetical protein